MLILVQTGWDIILQFLNLIDDKYLQTTELMK
jgi:hypothetical protein